VGTSLSLLSAQLGRRKERQSPVPGGEGRAGFPGLETRKRGRARVFTSTCPRQACAVRALHVPRPSEVPKSFLSLTLIFPRENVGVTATRPGLLPRRTVYSPWGGLGARGGRPSPARFFGFSSVWSWGSWPPPAPQHSTFCPQRSPDSQFCQHQGECR
jgi:hypothetical protein